MPIKISQMLAPSWWRIDEKDPEAAEFYIRPLNQLQFIDLRNAIGFNEFDRLTITSAGVDHALTHGLLDWRGVTNEKGEPLPYNPVNRQMLPPDVLVAIGFKIATISRLDDDQKKSSSSPSTSH